MIDKMERKDSVHLPRGLYPTKSYIARQLSQVFPFHSTKRFASLDCFHGLLFRLFPGFPMSINPFEKYSFPSFFVDKDIARRRARKHDSFFRIGGHSHSGIIPQIETGGKR